MTDLNLNESYSIQEAIITLVRNKLNEEKIKLWLAPYTQSGSDTGYYPDELVNRFHASLGILPETVRKAFEQLRRHALHKLASRQNSPATSPSGPILVKFKLVGFETGQNPKSAEHIVEVELSSFGKDLKSKALELIGSRVNATTIKLIHKGTLLSDSDRIASLMIRSGSTILVLNSSNNLAEEEQQASHLQQTKDDAELLSSADEFGSTNYLQVADQQGRAINLPANEKKALAVALTLHERGRSSMKSKKYTNALPFLLEADKEFSKCTSSVLSCVDNYALLNLDIAWCYLCLGSITDLPDAERRLTICQDSFEKSYGPNLERLKVLKGGHAKESALLARLHLLQGICAFHQKRFTEAQQVLERVSYELEDLKVEDSKLAEIISFGYSVAEARLALRNSRGNVENAVYHILKRREERKRIREQEKLERETKKKQQKLGKTIAGDLVQWNLYEQLLTMGYNPDKAKQALQQADNSISLAVQILQDQQELLIPIDEEKVAILMSMGFDQNAVEEALRSSDGDTAQAQENLVKSLALDPVIPSTSKEKSYKEAVDRLYEDIPSEEEDHLDLDLQEEMEFLKEYLLLIEK